jgi:hypothetical protein
MENKLPPHAVILRSNATKDLALGIKLSAKALRAKPSG